MHDKKSCRKKKKNTKILIEILMNNNNQKRRERNFFTKFIYFLFSCHKLLITNILMRKHNFLVNFRLNSKANFETWLSLQFATSKLCEVFLPPWLLFLVSIFTERAKLQEDWFQFFVDAWAWEILLNKPVWLFVHHLIATQSYTMTRWFNYIFFCCFFPLLISSFFV